MSQSPDSDSRSLSKLEKRIVRSVMTPNKNDLRSRGTNSLQTSSYHTNNYYPYSRDSSSKISGQGTWSAIREDDSLEDSSLFEDSLQTLIYAAKKGSTIELPSEPLSVQDLFIEKSVKLSRGSLDVQNGSIRIQAKKHIKVELTELFIQFELIHLTSQPLFIIEGNCEVTVSDCYFKSKNTNQDTCFSVIGHAILNISSCQITDFFQGVEAAMSVINIERSYFDNCRNDALHLVDPSQLSIDSSYIRKNTQAGVYVRFVENSYTSIEIKNNVFRSNGIYIRGERSTELQGSIDIANNNIRGSRKEGITLKHLHMSRIFIRENKIKASSKTCCWIQKVKNVDLRDNKFSKSSSYGLYLYGTSAKIANTEIMNNKLGGVFFVGNSEELSISSGEICNNYDTGVYLMQVASSQVKLSNLKVFANAGNGIYATFQGPSFGSQVVLENCDVYDNQEFGVITSKVPFKIDDCRLTNNLNGPFSMDQESLKHKKLVCRHTKGIPKQGHCLLL